MTTDKKKAALYLSITLIIGILIGSLIPAFYGRFRHREGKDMRDGREMRGGKDNKQFGNKQEWLTNRIIRIVKPDSSQVKEIRPLTSQAAAQIGELEKGSNERMSAIMDSLNTKLRPILNDEQNKRLDEFSSKARQRWKKRD